MKTFIKVYSQPKTFKLKESTVYIAFFALKEFIYKLFEKNKIIQRGTKFNLSKKRIFYCLVIYF